MPTEKEVSVEKKSYDAPKLAVFGDVDAITLGDDIGEDLDAGFTTNVGVRGRKKPKIDPFS